MNSVSRFKLTCSRNKGKKNILKRKHSSYKLQRIKKIHPLQKPMICWSMIKINELTCSIQRVILLVDCTKVTIQDSPTSNSKLACQDNIIYLAIKYSSLQSMTELVEIHIGKNNTVNCHLRLVQTLYFSCAKPDWIILNLEQHWHDIWFRWCTGCPA